MPLSNEACWRLLLEIWARDEDVLPLIAQLLCCSQEMASVVHQTCMGRLSARFHAADRQPAPPGPNGGQMQLEQFSVASKQLISWLAKHKALLSSLVIAMAPQLTDSHHYQQRHARHLPGSSQVEEPSSGLLSRAAPSSLSLPLSVAPAAAVWQQLRQLLPNTRTTHIPVECLSLASRTLTELHWSVSSSGTPTAFIRALPALQHLKALGLYCGDTGAGTGSLSALAPALQPLSQLTRLTLQRFSISTASAQQLPGSLLELCIGPQLDRLTQDEADCMQGWCVQPLQLQHLTRLQRLQLHSLNGCDALPAGLTSLRVGACNALVLSSLRQLQQLNIQADASELLLMVVATHLQQLQDVQLTCRGTWLTPVGFKHLSRLPLTRLHILCELPHNLLPWMGRCAQLKDLSLQLQQVDSTAQHQLAAQLVQLSALEVLSLSLHAPTQAGLYDIAAVAVGVAEAAAMEAEAWEPVAVADVLVSAVLGLPKLRSLQLQGLLLTGKQRAQLAGVEQLVLLKVQ